MKKKFTLKRVLATTMAAALALTSVTMTDTDTSAKETPSVKVTAKVTVGETEKLKVNANGYKVKSVKVSSSKKDVATATASKKKIKVKGVSAGKATLTVKIKAVKSSKKSDKAKTFKSKIDVSVAAATGANPSTRASVAPAATVTPKSSPTPDNSVVLNSEKKDATDITKAKNAAWLDRLDFDDKSEEENAKRGLIEAPEAPVIKDVDGNIVWDVSVYDFIKEMAELPESKLPGTINPSLFRNTLYNSYAGLFEVCDGIYQVRGYDMSNATFIRTDNGWIVFDVLMCKQDMAEAKALMEAYAKKELGLESLDIKAVLYSHSHVDHYGGIYGLLDQSTVSETVAKKTDDWDSQSDQIDEGKISVIAPEGFLEHAVSENIYAGSAMSRRAQYQYGVTLGVGEKGRLAMGIGLGQSVGNTGLLAPTYDVTKNETIVIDGLEVQIQLTPGTEAPAEMNAYFPKYRGLWLAENCTGTMHNVYTLRGAEVRDAADWATYILEAEQMFGDKTDVVFQSHNWPHWDTENIKTYMENTAAVYQFIHDQTLYYANDGYTPNEISNMLKLPDKLDRVWYTRQYYGTLKHNIKAVYQKYLGWYDANPVNLDPLPPEETAKKWVEYLGDIDKVIKMAKADFDKGEYQWVAQVMKEIVFADPSNTKARQLYADALEQLGYQAESGTWRNIYLTGANELRNGNQSIGKKNAGGSNDVRAAMTADMMLDYIGIATDALAAQDDDLSFNLNISDTGEKYYIKRSSGVVLVYKERTEDDVDATLTCPKQALLGIMGGSLDSIKDKVKIEGDDTVLDRFGKYIKVWTRDFNIVEP